MKNIWKKHKIKIIALVYAIGVVAFFYFAVFSLAERIISKSDEIQKKILDQQIKNERISKIAPVEEDYAYTQENKRALEVTLNQDGGADFIKKMENIAQETGNKISFKVEDDVLPKTKSKSKKDDTEKTILEALSYDSYISIELDLKGNYSGLNAFLTKLENTRNYVNVVSIETKIEKEENKGGNSAVNRSQIGFFSGPVGDNGKDVNQEKNILHSTIDIVAYTKK